MPIHDLFIDQNDIVVHFETQDMIDAALFSGLILDIVSIARQPAFFGPHVELRFSELRTGSLTAKLKINSQEIANWAGIGSFALAIVLALKSPAEPAGQKCAQIMVDQSVTLVEVKTSEQHWAIDKNSPAVQALLSGRTFNHEPANRPAALSREEAEENVIEIGARIPDNIRDFVPITNDVTWRHFTLGSDGMAGHITFNGLVRFRATLEKIGDEFYIHHDGVDYPVVYEPNARYFALNRASWIYVDPKDGQGYIKYAEEALPSD